MAFKIFFIFALACVILAEKKKKDLGNELGKALALGGLQQYLNDKSNSSLIWSCYEPKAQKYNVTVQRFANELTNATEEFNLNFKKENQTIVQGVYKNLKKIVDLMIPYPKELTELLKTKNVKKAANLMENTQNNIDLESDQTIIGMLKLNETSHPDSRKFGQKLDVVRAHIENVTKEITEDFVSCMK